MTLASQYMMIHANLKLKFQTKMLSKLNLVLHHWQIT